MDKIENLKMAAIIIITFCIGYITSTLVYMQEVAEIENGKNKLQTEYNILLDEYNENLYMYKKMEGMSK